MSISFMSKELACASINELAKQNDCKGFVENFRKSIPENQRGSTVEETEKLWFISMQHCIANEWDEFQGFSSFLSHLNVSDPIVLARILKKIAEITESSVVFHRGCGELFQLAGLKNDYKTQLQLAGNNPSWMHANQDAVMTVIEESLKNLGQMPDLLAPLQEVFKASSTLHQQTSDLQFLSSDHSTIYAHAALLRTIKSSYIENILSTTWKYSKTIQVDFDAQALTALMDYYEKGMPLAPSAPVAVWEAAHYFQLEAVQKEYEKLVVGDEKRVYPALLAAMLVGTREFEKRCLCSSFFPALFDNSDLRVPIEIFSELVQIQEAYNAGVYFEEKESIPTLVITDLSSNQAVKAVDFYLKRHNITALEIRSAGQDLVTGDKKLIVPDLRVNLATVSREWLEKNIDFQAVRQLTYANTFGDSFPFPVVVNSSFDSHKGVEQINIRGTSLELSGDNFESFCSYVRQAPALKQISLESLGAYATAAEFELFLEAISANSSIETVSVRFSGKKFVQVLHQKNMQFSQVKLKNTGERVCVISQPASGLVQNR